MYTGEFKAGKKHGQGTYSNPNGKSWTGRFENGRQVEEESSEPPVLGQSGAAPAFSTFA